MIQRYAIAQRLQVEFDQLSKNQSEASNRSRGSSSSDSSLEENRNRFKRVFNSKKEVRDTMDYTFETERCEIRELTGEKIDDHSCKVLSSSKFALTYLTIRWLNLKYCELVTDLNL